MRRDAVCNYAGNGVDKYVSLVTKAAATGKVLVLGCEDAEAAKAAKSTPANLKEKIEHMQAEMKALQSEIESLKSKAAKDALGDVMNQVKEVNGVRLLATAVEDVDMNGLRDLGDQLKEKLGEALL